jgi:hypothetical protein
MNGKTTQFKATRQTRHAGLSSRFGSRAMHCISTDSKTGQIAAPQSTEEQRGYSIYKCCSRVVLAQKHRTAIHRIARHGSAPQSKKRQPKAAQIKATRSVHLVN